MNYEHRRYLAEKGLNRLLCTALSREHFDRYLDLALAYSGDAPDIETVNELVIASASARVR